MNTRPKIEYHVYIRRSTRPLETLTYHPGAYGPSGAALRALQLHLDSDPPRLGETITFRVTQSPDPESHRS